MVKFNTKINQTLTIFKDALETRAVSSFSMGVFRMKIFDTVSCMNKLVKEEVNFWNSWWRSIRCTAHFPKSKFYYLVLFDMLSRRETGWFLTKTLELRPSDSY